MAERHFQIVYIFPNLFTAASIFSGVISIVSSIHGDFKKAVWLIFLSLLFDGLDGRIARMTHTTSRFGAEFDSQADIVAFGAAPAILLYTNVAQAYGRFGVLVTALYIIFGAIRLARFNVMSPKSDPTVFIGVPIPTAAVFVSIWVLMYERYESLHRFDWMLLFAVLLLSFLMVSHIRYPSFKTVQLKKPMLTKTLILLIGVASLLYLFPIEGFALMITLYIVWGVGRAVYMLFFRKSANRS
ncbi:CDP-diacylglycerol--serine O-phosphatidyltransferase [Hydrogenimonas urashimensis]|uniref:CDP-diacylglycerol--serine O-phosphatidyltransferase n=1 Tax=Hydrogenimonas urashimensis TaxID=2740515 RepID=UPI00191606A3|nr:CDP-diacylglycerol--serine O-phosphatidyltransferase [Hydrogenimonas urashimensis]